MFTYIVFTAASTLIMLHLINKAPYGYQDEQGFHYGVEKVLK